MINLKQIINFSEDVNISLNSDELRHLVKKYNSDVWEEYQKFDKHTLHKKLSI